MSRIRSQMKPASEMEMPGGFVPGFMPGGAGGVNPSAGPVFRPSGINGFYPGGVSPVGPPVAGPGAIPGGLSPLAVALGLTGAGASIPVLKSIAESLPQPGTQAQRYPANFPLEMPGWNGTPSVGESGPPVGFFDVQDKASMNDRPWPVPQPGGGKSRDVMFQYAKGLMENNDLQQAGRDIANLVQSFRRPQAAPTGPNSPEALAMRDKSAAYGPGFTPQAGDAELADLVDRARQRMAGVGIQMDAAGRPMLMPLRVGSVPDERAAMLAQAEADATRNSKERIAGRERLAKARNISPGESDESIASKFDLNDPWQALMVKTQQAVNRGERKREFDPAQSDYINSKKFAAKTPPRQPKTLADNVDAALRDWKVIARRHGDGAANAITGERIRAAYMGQLGGGGEDGEHNPALLSMLMGAPAFGSYMDYKGKKAVGDAAGPRKPKTTGDEVDDFIRRGLPVENMKPEEYNRRRMELDMADLNAGKPMSSFLKSEMFNRAQLAGSGGKNPAARLEDASRELVALGMREPDAKQFVRDNWNRFNWWFKGDHSPSEMPRDFNEGVSSGARAGSKNIAPKKTTSTEKKREPGLTWGGVRGL